MMLDTLFYRFGESRGVGRVDGRTILVSIEATGKVSQMDLTHLSQSSIEKRLEQFGPYLGTVHLHDGTFDTLDAQAPWTLSWHRREATWTAALSGPETAAQALQTFDGSLPQAQQVQVTKKQVNESFFQLCFLVEQQLDPEEVLLSIDLAGDTNPQVNIRGYGQPADAAVVALGMLTRVGGFNGEFSRIADDATQTLPQIGPKALSFIGASLQDGRLLTLARDIGLAPDDRVPMPRARLRSVGF